MKGAAGEAGRVHLSDGSFFVLHAEIIAREGISAGARIDPARLSVLLARSEKVFARARALALLARAPHSKRGLARKLLARGFSREAVAAAVARMGELGYINDREFAQSWVRSRMAARAEGWKALYQGLLRRGVPRALAEEVVEGSCSFEEELASARRLTDGLPPAQAVRRLSSRGFRSRVIARVLREREGKGRGGEEE